MPAKAGISGGKVIPWPPEIPAIAGATFKNGERCAFLAQPSLSTRPGLAMGLNPMHIHPLISDTATLTELCARLAKSPYVAVDTEFMR
jgi:hypothetical protein